MIFDLHDMRWLGSSHCYCYIRPLHGLFQNMDHRNRMFSSVSMICVSAFCSGMLPWGALAQGAGGRSLPCARARICC